MLSTSINLVPLTDTTADVGNLLLDPNNYRYQDEPGFRTASADRFHEENVQLRAAQRLRQSGVQELKSSILTNGFLPFEKIVVRTYPPKLDMYVVVEGNRRVAALKWIRDDHEAGVEIDQALLAVLDDVPVTLVDEDADDSLLLSLMGVRHVGGIKEWGGYQSAKLVAALRDDHDLDPSEVAARLAMTAHEVNRRYRAYKALQQMMSDEEFSDQARPDMYPLFHDAVSRTVVKDWLGWDDEDAEFGNAEELAQFYDLLTPSDGSDGEQIPPKLVSRENVSALRFVLPVPEAKRSLLDTTQSFDNALGLAKAKELSRTWVAQVGEALGALKGVGALELRKLEDSHLEQLEELKGAAEELLELHAALSKA